MMPFHLCGSIADFIRFGYRTKMRIVAGQPGIDVKWIKARPDAKPLDFDNPYGSAVWQDDWRQALDLGAFGEVPGVWPKWIDLETAPARPCPPGPYWPERFRPGVGIKDALSYPVIRMDADNWPDGCCQDPDFVFTYRSCWDYMRLPLKIRVQAFHNAATGLCVNADGTDFAIQRGIDGIWRGNGVFGSTGEPISFVLPDPDLPFDDCWATMRWINHPANFQRWKIAANPLQQVHTVNPPSVFWATPDQNGWQTGFLPCGPFIIIAPFSLLLSVYSYE